MQIKQSIFREYDIRGVAGNKFDTKIVEEYERWYGKFPGVTLDLEAAEAIGKSYGTIISNEGGKNVLVGYEDRPFGKELKEAFVKGIVSTGVSVIDAGVLLTPMVYFFIAHLKLDGGVSITGSHNVYFYNGFKMMKKGVWPLYGVQMQEMYQLILKDSYLVGKTVGTIEQRDELKKIYFDYIFQHIKLQRKLKVVVDCGNGCAGLYAVDYLTKLGCETVGLFTELDTTYPNHVPDPEPPQNLKDLQKAVIEHKADIGIAFDADGDRAGFVDEEGVIVQPDDMLIIMSKDALKRHPGKKVLYDVKSTALLDMYVKQFGGIPLIHKTGHAPIKETFRKDTDIIIGGEVSGHMFFSEDYYGIDDGLWAAARVLELVSKGTRKFSEYINELIRPVRTPEIKLPTQDEVKFDVIKKVTEVFKKKYKVLDIDGSRIIFSDKSWALVRASNTSPYLTLRFEAPTEAEVLKMKNLVADELDTFSEVGDKLNRSAVATLTGKLGWL